MLRNVYLEGEMGEKFGTGFQIYADSVADVMRCLEANIGDEIRNYLIDCHNKDIGFVVDVADNAFDDEKELLMPMHAGDVTITPMAAGSKSAFGKILAAIALVVIAIYAPQLYYTQVGTATGVKASLTTFGKIMTLGGTMTMGTSTLMLGALAVNLAMSGIMQMMAPDPSVDDGASTPDNYLFNGPVQSVVQGDPVPVLYGKLRVPGQPVNFEITGAGYPKLATFGNNEDGSSYIVERNSEKDEQ
tara:strand:- start:206 stop:940 length:735 start_codon:yes stop_codon:yes gene_type:complete